MNSSLGDNKKRLGGSASSLTEMKRRSVVGQTWNFTSKQPKLPSAAYITTVEAMTASTLAFENARNAGVVPRINIFVAVPSTTLTATVAPPAFTPIQISSMVAIADSPIFSVSPALPFGMSISPSTGTISGTPMETISATVFTVTVTANSIYPTIVSNSAIFSLSVGDAATGLTYTGYSGTIRNLTLPTIDNQNSDWGTLNTNVVTTAAVTPYNAGNQLFSAADGYYDIALYFTGYFKAPETGTYVFSETSDDGFQWNLNGTRIIDIPGSGRSGSATTGGIALVANRYYPTSGLWSQGGGPGNLTFTAISIGGTNKIGTYPIKTRFYH